jgi:iron complex transport system ATP-binding protein
VTTSATPSANGTGSPVLAIHGVGFRREGRDILADIDWEVQADERWLVLGANGSGKTTLMKIASMHEHPTTGTVQVLGETLGRTDVRVLRRRLGFASSALGAQLRPSLSALDVVMTAKYAALEPWWHQYDDADRARALECLERMAMGRFAARELGTLSSGEQQRVFLARTLMNDPAIVMLDEPSARLDLGGREQLVGALSELTLDPAAPPLVLITHHVDEVPPGVTHALLLLDGQVLTRGPIEEALTSETLSACFGVPLELLRRDSGRYAAWALA